MGKTKKTNKQAVLKKKSGPSFSVHLKSVTIVTCLSPKFIHPNYLRKSIYNCSMLCLS